MSTYRNIQSDEQKITWAASIAFKIALNFKNPYRKIAIITPKGTGKSENITQWQVQLQAKEIILPEGEILNIKNTQASNKETLYENLKDYYNKWNLPCIATWNNNQQNIIYNDHTISFKGKDKQVTQLTGWKRKVSLMFEDEALNGDDSKKNVQWLEEQQAKDLNIFSSVSRNFLDNPKTEWTAKSITATNLHYRDGLYYPMFESLDTDVVLSEGEEKGYSVRIISKDHPSNAFGVDVMMLFVSPELNEFLPEHVKNIKYKNAFKQETMKKFVPDLTKDPLYAHAQYVNYIKFRDDINTDIHYCGMGIDPASGRDEYVVSHVGVIFDPKTKVPLKVVPLWFTVLKTNEIEHDSIQTAIKNFHKKVFEDFLKLRAATHTGESFFVTVDTNQQTTSDQLFKYIKTELNKLLIGDDRESKLEMEFDYKVTDKNKLFKPQARAEILNYLIRNDKILAFDNSSTRKWKNQLLKIKRQFKVNSNDEYKILSNGGDDLYDAFNMAMEGFLLRTVMLKLFDEPETFYALIKTNED